ncbi:MAG: type IX secretion system protein PorQ [Saprospiraceae bacterium]|nr:type IX secretion system protein PorQ [Saprospiraceae bacterium]
MKNALLLLTFLLSGGQLLAQIGGDAVYQFLELPQSARVSALGGVLITVLDDDVSLAMSNPAVANAGMHQQLSFNHNFHLGGIQNGYAAFGWYVPKWDATLHGGMQYVAYGTFDETDVYGDVIGEFKAADYALTIGAGKSVYERLSVGANIRVINSQYANYDSWGLGFDMAAIFHDTASRINVSLVARNAGWQLNTYTADNREPMPFDLQLGISKQLAHLPFRFSVVYHHLDQWNILYDDPNQVEDFLFFGEEPTKSGNPAIDNLFRHFIFSGEFLLGAKENLHLRVGYDHQRKKELSVNNYRSLAGFSLGLGMKISKFRIDYGHAFYHLAGGINHVSISTNLRAFGTKRILE